MRENGAKLKELAEGEGITGPYVTPLIRVTLLAPDITQAMLEGRPRPDLSAARRMRATHFPLDWTAQRVTPGLA